MLQERMAGLVQQINKEIEEIENIEADHFPPLVTEEEAALLKKVYSEPLLRQLSKGMDNANVSGAWIQTYSCKKFNPLIPDPTLICIEDIAHSLSMQCRFAGHCKEFYSIAQHCVLVSYLSDTKDALHGLLHDASETYLIDVPTPLKHSGKFKEYLSVEKSLQDIIYKKFSLYPSEPKSVAKADKVMLATEARDLMSPVHPEWVNKEKPVPFKIQPLSPRDAENLFMDRFIEITVTHKEYYLK